MAGPIRFWWRGGIVDVDDVPAGTSVLDWLRRDPSATGTKEGCNEGDCGACTVVVGDRVPDQAASVDQLDLHPANACLLLLPMLHGRALFTVEDVASDGELHPVQQAMVEHSGSQCGYCTPGIVMSLWCAFERTRGREPPNRAALADCLSGNLCRCTGYRSVLDAAEAAIRSREAARTVPAAAVLAALASIPSADPLDYRAAGTTFLAPTTAAGLVEALAGHPDAVVIAGGTDLVLTARQAGQDLPPLVWTGRVHDLTTVTRTATHLLIGGAASLESAWGELAAQLPSLGSWWHRFGSPAIRSAGTMAGNVANGSPIADGTPVLLALDTVVVLADSTGERRVDLAEFHVGRRETVLRPGEVLLRLEIPLASFRRDLRAYKVSRRFDSDISTVSGVFALVLDGEVVTEVRVVLGGMAAVVRRARSVESAIRDRPWTRETVLAAQDALDLDLSPISDHRGSADYRRRTARALLERWWLQTRPAAPLSEEQTEVWAIR